MAKDLNQCEPESDPQLSKECEACGTRFGKRYRDSMKQWGGRRFCSPVCANRSRKKRPLLDRFIEKIKIVQGGCIEWQGTLDARGYGHLAAGYKQPPLKAHRLSYQLFRGEIPDGLNVCHKCDNPRCVNPNHLFVGTQKDNMTDAFKKGRIDNYVHGAGEDSARAKLTAEQVADIRAEFANGATIRDLEEKYNHTNIVRILRNRSYYDENFTPINGNKKPRYSRRKLGASEIQFILSSPLPSRALAKALSVSKFTILEVRKGAKNG